MERAIDRIPCYLFNPQHDLALAHGGATYCPPPLARRIASDLAALPLWYADPQAKVVLPDHHARLHFPPKTNEWKISERWLSPHHSSSRRWELPDARFLEPRVWGWNPLVRRQWQEWGIGNEIPTDDELSALRKFAHRSTTITVQNALRPWLDPLIELPRVLSTMGEIKQFVESYPLAVLKAPWSGSGQGLAWTMGEWNRTTEQWCSGVLRRQRVLIGEKVYDKQTDFAFLYAKENGRLVFQGYSLFQTNAKGVYEGNRLLSNERIEQRLTTEISVDDLRAMALQLGAILSPMTASLPCEEVGVDAMVIRTSLGVAIHPCVEINARMTMGMVARRFYDRYLSSDSEGEFRIEYYPTTEQRLKQHHLDTSLFPLDICEGRIREGYLALDGMLSEGCYRAAVKVHSRR